MIRFCPIKSPDLKLSCKTYWYIRIVNSQSSTSTSCSIVNMPSTRRHSYDLNFKLKIVAEAEAVNNNREIAREHGISESMERKWHNQQHVLFSRELRMTAKRASMGCYRPKDPELDQQLDDWFSDQRTQGKHLAFNLDLYWWIVINVSEPRSLRCDVYIQWLVSITKLTFGFVVTQVCQSTAWCFEWRPKNSAPTPSLKCPLAGTQTGSVVTPSPWERRPVLLSVSQPTWKTRSSSFIDSSWDLASAGATIEVVSSIWTKHQCGLSCRPPETWSLPGAEQSQCCHAAATSKVSQLLWQWERTAKNSHWKPYSKVFGRWKSSTRHQGCKFQCTRKAGWTKKVCFISTLFIQRRNFSSERQTRFSEFETVLLSLISCYWAHAVKHVCKCSFVCFSLEVV